MYIHILLSSPHTMYCSSLLKGMTSWYLPDKTPNRSRNQNMVACDSRMLKNDLHRMVAWSNQPSKWQVGNVGKWWEMVGNCQQGACLPQAKPWSIHEPDLSDKSAWNGFPFLWILEISGNFGLVTSESWGKQLPPNKDVFSWLSSGSRNLRWNSEMARTSARSWSNLIKFIRLVDSHFHGCSFPLLLGESKKMWIGGSAKEHFCDPTNAPALLERSWDKLRRQLVFLLVIPYHMSMLHVTCPNNSFNIHVHSHYSSPQKEWTEKKCKNSDELLRCLFSDC